ncbi:folylpolyglutamate synthase [Saitoella coloradoensis]
MVSSLRIAIFECDTPVPAVLKRYGTYGSIFTNLLTRASEATTPAVTVRCDCFDVIKGEYPDSLSKYDGILITGSRHCSFGDDPWIVKLSNYVSDVYQYHPKVKLIGICFGHQIIARALGGTVQKNDKGWEVAVTETKLTPEGRAVLATTADTLKLQQMHRDIVSKAPAGVHVFASNEICDGHPEFTQFIVEELLRTRQEQKIFAEDMVEEAWPRAAGENDGENVARGIITFLLKTDEEKGGAEYLRRGVLGTS